MKNIEITSKNVNTYRKLLKIKEGKLFLNKKCTLIPSILFVLEILVFINIFIVNPFINIGTETITGVVRLVLFGGCFGISAKLNLLLSKIMSVSYFKRQHPEIDTDIDTIELKQLLNEYSQIKRFNQHKYLNETDVIIPEVKSIKKMSLEEQKRMLQRESDFLKQSKNTGSNHGSKGYQKRIK